MDVDIVALEKEYCPPIETATFYAIILDYDLKTEAGLKCAHSILESIRSSAEAEEATGFDPSGSSTRNAENALDHLDNSSSRPDENVSKSTETELSYSATSTSLGAGSSAQYEQEIEELSFEDKEALLAETFPNFPLSTISHTLKKSHSNFEAAVDELLTIAFFEDNTHSDGEKYAIPKSIDGFTQNASISGTNKRKKRRQRKVKLDAQSHAMPGSSESLPLYTPNIWDRGTREIEYISQRSCVPRSVVASIYHLNGASLSNSIRALATDDNVLKAMIPADDPSISATTNAMIADFSTLNIAELTGISRMTHPSTAAAHELAMAIIENPFPSFKSRENNANIVAQYSKLTINDNGPASDDFLLVKSPNRANVHHKASSSNPAIVARKYAIARQQAFEKASAAYKRSRSDRLMGGVASYYASIGRDATAMADIYSAEAADSLVARQSTATQIDLHGIDVKNAVRISLESTERWWNGGASEYAREGKVAGGREFAIITGVGRHSQSGKARIGPAVKKALVANGWRIEDNSGVVLVRGKERR